MRALLDTHTFLWWDLDSPKLSPTAKKFIADGNNQIYFSAVSAWEIAIKYAKGHLILPELPNTYIMKRVTEDHFIGLSVQINHALQVATLPSIHQDPFDRLLIAHSQIDKLPLLTVDAAISQYQIDTLW